ncbi:MAG: hypothetical protein KDK34_11045, partial [Leptospiraceae bacterium]|nr:hypothetical protein [Leptospiraceae bacterium]
MIKNKRGACIKSSLFGRKCVLPVFVTLLIGDGSGCRLLQRDVPAQFPEAIQEATLPIPEESVITENTSENDPTQDIPTNNTIVDNRPTAKGRLIITRLSGYELIRETVQRDGLPVTRYTIRGNATIVHQGVVIRAARMVIDDGRFGELQGGVRIIDRANGVTVISATAEYNRDEQVVHLVGNPYMIVQRPGQETALVSTNRITRKLEAGKSILDGDVRIKQGEWTLLADEGVYSDSEDLIVMRDDPLIIGRDRYMVASKLNYEVDRKRIRLKTDVALYSRGSGLALDDSASNDANQQLPSLMEFARRGGRIDARELQTSGETVADGPLTSILTSDELIYHFPDDAEPFTTVTGNVLLTRDDMRLSSPYIEAIGRDFHTIWTDQGIDMLDRKRDMH